MNRMARAAAYVQPKKILFQELSTRLQSPSKPLLLIDVRFPSKFRSGSLPTAKNIQADKLYQALACTTAQEFEEIFQFKKPSLTDEIVLFCQHGIKAREAADNLAVACGYSNLRVYEGSMAEWNLMMARKSQNELANESSDSKAEVDEV